MSHTQLRRFRTAAVALALTSAPAAAQSLNVDVGINFNEPANTYAGAAASPGHWNQLSIIQPVNTPYVMNDLTGAATPATLEYNKLGNGNWSFDNPLTLGDDEALLDDFCDIGGTVGDKVRFRFKNLSAGTYDVYVYAWASDDPFNFQSLVTVVGGANGAMTCGGQDWSGVHVLGETYVMDTVTTATGQFSVIVETAQGFGSCNGIQLVKQGSGCSSNPVNYCTAGTSASGCQATISSAGSASATASSGFTVSASGVEGAKDALFFYGQNGRQASSWGNGTSLQCVVTPVKRGGLLTGTGTSGQCDGTFAQDLNARWCPTCSNPNHNPVVGQKMQIQLWYRDPFNTSNQTTSLSDALEVDICP